MNRGSVKELKMFRTTKNRTALVVSTAVGLVAPSAMAAPKPFCQTYAQVAVNQSNAMQAQNRGCMGFRWHNWYDGHYQWCRSSSKASAKSETLVRKRALFGGPC
jgi:hypothetical protein